ncbi:MAG: hypothetical protein ACM3PP_00125 [Candidatus Saccharibacteria bacterium]
MPTAGDFYECTLKEAHLGWGELGPSREDHNRSELEAYIPISKNVAERLLIYKQVDYNGRSSDGFLNCTVRATGSRSAGDPFAKQFQTKGDLREMGRWLKGHCGAVPGDIVRVEFTSQNDVVFTYIQVP